MGLTIQSDVKWCVSHGPGCMRVGSLASWDGDDRRVVCLSRWNGDNTRARPLAG